MSEKRKVFVINPGSTSTKIAIFEENEKLFELNVAHDDETVQKSVPEQLPLRMAFIENAVKEAGALRSEGKEYVMQDGDIVFFRFNV